MLPTSARIRCECQGLAGCPSVVLCPVGELCRRAVGSPLFATHKGHASRAAVPRLPPVYLACKSGFPRMAVKDNSGCASTESTAPTFASRRAMTSNSFVSKSDALARSVPATSASFVAGARCCWHRGRDGPGGEHRRGMWADFLVRETVHRSSPLLCEANGDIDRYRSHVATEPGVGEGARH